MFLIIYIYSSTHNSLSDYFWRPIDSSYLAFKLCSHIKLCYFILSLFIISRH